MNPTDPAPENQTEPQMQTPKGLAHAAWLIGSAVVPQALLLFLLYRDYELMRSVIGPDMLLAWRDLFWILGLSCVGLLAFAGFHLVKNRALPGRWFAPLLTIVGAAMLFGALYYSADFYPGPGVVPAFLVSPDSGWIYFLTFLSPTILYGLVLSAIARTSAEAKFAGLRQAALSFAGVIAIPTTLYLFFMFSTGARSGGLDAVLEIAMPLTLVGGTVAFFFLLIRGLLLIGRGQLGELLQSDVVQVPLRLLVGLVSPLVGLLLNNNGHWIDAGHMTHIFGDFDHPGFYIFAVLNGIALALPDQSDPRRRLWQFAARLLLLPYTIYFALVFLPYLPLALLAIVLFGLGFLMLTPLVLAVIHLQVLVRDYHVLAAAGAPAARALRLATVAVLLWPIGITLSYWNERSTLHAALDYLHQPDLAKTEADLNTSTLRKTLLEVRRYKASGGTPWLGLYYRWFVLDNLTLSDAKLDRMQRLFFGVIEHPRTPQGFWGANNGLRGGGAPRPPTNFASLRGINARTVFDARRGLYRSSIDLRLFYARGEVNGQGLAEYNASFTLPPDARVTEYYLDIQGQREYGMLAERKSALWIYNQIVSQRQDPGLLYYETDRRLRLRVFPINPGETRTSGLEILHAVPFRFEIDGRSVNLSAPKALNAPGAAAAGVERFAGGVYILPAAKASAEPAARRPYLSFVLDCALPPDLKSVARSIEQQSRESRYQSRSGFSGPSEALPAVSSQAIAAQNADYLARIDSLLQERPAFADMARNAPVQIACANYEYAVTELAANGGTDERQAALHRLRDEIPPRGSWSLERTLRSLSLRHLNSGDRSPGFPVFVVLPAEPNRPTPFLEPSGWDWMLPETPFYFALGQNAELLQIAFAGDMQPAELAANSGPTFAPTARIAIPDTAGKSPANTVAYIYLRRDDANPAASIVPDVQAGLRVADTALSTLDLSAAASKAQQSNERTSATDLTREMLFAAAALDANHRLYPAVGADEYLNTVRAAFAGHILLYPTSFLSLETEAQKIALQRKQAQVLRGTTALDAGEEPLELSEPGLGMGAVILILAVLGYAVVGMRLRPAGLRRA